MADRRCLSRKIMESDAFRDLTFAAQSLYVQLYMEGDDDGFVNCAKAIASSKPGWIGSLKKLVDEGYLLKFGEIYVIKHWRIGNSLKNDRKKQLMYPEIARQIYLEPNRAYTTHPYPGCLSLWEVKNGVSLESNLESISESNLESQPNLTEPNLTELNLTELNRTELNRTELNRTEPADADFGGGFERVFELYPAARRGNREKAYSVYCRVISTEERGRKALENLKLYRSCSQWTRENGRYVPSLLRWLEDGYWEICPENPGPIYGSTGLGDAELEAIQKLFREEENHGKPIYAHQEPLFDLPV